MSDVQRYDLEQPDSHMGSAKMQREDYGDWVSFEDYTALRARLEAVEKERDAAKESARWAYIDGCLDGDDDAVLARAERAEAALATARRDALEEAAKVRGLWLQFNTEGEIVGWCTVEPHDPGDMKFYVSRDAIRALIAQEEPTT